MSMFLSRPEIYYNLVRIRHLHEEFLRELRRVTPYSEKALTAPTTSLSITRAIQILRKGPSRLRLGKARRASQVATDLFQETTAGPMEAHNVAHELEKLATQVDPRCSDGQSQSALFSAYEEFCRRYDLLTEDMAILRRSLPNWPTWEKGIEALSKSVASRDCQRRNANQSMTLSDLLVKVGTDLVAPPNHG